MNNSNETGVAAIIQARCGSTRHYNKIFEPIGDKPLLWWVVKRLRDAKLVDHIIIATTVNAPDDAVESFAKSEGLLIARGSEEDVLDRFINAIKLCPAKTIVRATGDNPLVDSPTLDLMISSHLESQADYTSIEGAVPTGSGAEVVSAEALERSWREAKGAQYHEHVTPYIHTNPDKFRINRIVPPDYMAGKNYRITVDTAQDLALMRALHDELKERGKPFDFQNAMELLIERPDIAAINQDVRQKSWTETA